MRRRLRQVFAQVGRTRRQFGADGPMIGPLCGEAEPNELNLRARPRRA